MAYNSDSRHPGKMGVQQRVQHRQQVEICRKEACDSIASADLNGRHLYLVRPSDCLHMIQALQPTKLDLLLLMLEENIGL